jgi:hypothetical protein
VAGATARSGGAADRHCGLRGIPEERLSESGGYLESAVSFDRTEGGHRFALRKDVRAQRGMSCVKTMSIAILFLVGSPIIARAATIEEVERCRAIRYYIQRWDCFKSLKAKREDTPKAKREDTPSPIIRDEQKKAPGDPASPSSIDHLSVTPGEPLCVDQDSLAAMLVAGMLAANAAQAVTIGCQTIPEDAQVELLQRFPSGFQFLRIVKVKVTFPSQPDPTVGYTVEISR